MDGRTDYSQIPDCVENPAKCYNLHTLVWESLTQTENWQKAQVTIS